MYVYIQAVSRLVEITAGGDFLGLCDQIIHINMFPILDGYGVMGITYIQDVPGGRDKTSGECSLC